MTDYDGECEIEGTVYSNPTRPEVAHRRLPLREWVSLIENVRTRPGDRGRLIVYHEPGRRPGCSRYSIDTLDLCILLEEAPDGLLPKLLEIRDRRMPDAPPSARVSDDAARWMASLPPLTTRPPAPEQHHRPPPAPGSS